MALFINQTSFNELFESSGGKSCHIFFSWVTHMLANMLGSTCNAFDIVSNGGKSRV